MVRRSEGSGRDYVNPGIFGEQLAAIRHLPLGQSEAAALRWLEANAVPLGSGIVWRCDYDTVYNEDVITAPWSSGYAQASIIGGLLSLHSLTDDNRYLELAVKAGRAYAVATDAGGLAERLSNGRIWFEEITTPELARQGRSPHVCNGHLWATLQLSRLGRRSGDRSVQELAREGVGSIKAMLPTFDSGSWIRYDLYPRRSEIRFALVFTPRTSGPAGVQEAHSLRGPCISAVTLRVPGQAERAIRLRIGAIDDDEGAWRVLSGSYGSEFGVIKWGPRDVSSGVECRRVASGKSVFALELPEGADQDLFREPFLELCVDWLDDGSPGSLDARVFGMREQVESEFAELPGSAAECVADGSRHALVKTVRLCDLSPSSIPCWKITGAYVQPLRALREESGDSAFGDWADRLEGYMARLRAEYPDRRF